MSGNAPDTRSDECERARERGFLSQLRDFLNHASDPAVRIAT
jgi:hypothetical protein